MFLLFDLVVFVIVVFIVFKIAKRMILKDPLVHLDLEKTKLKQADKILDEKEKVEYLERKLNKRLSKGGKGEQFRSDEPPMDR